MLHVYPKQRAWLLVAIFRSAWEAVSFRAHVAYRRIEIVQACSRLLSSTRQGGRFFCVWQVPRCACRP